ncbi:MAG: hypothetical protein ACM31C_28965 [Acidobacteriota bacterium]
MAIGLDRRELLVRTGVILLLVPLATACASYGGSGPGTDAASCDGIDTTSSVAASHTHTLCVPNTDLSSPPAAGATYTTSNNGGHTHTVTLAQAQLQQIEEGGTVTVTSSNVQGHTHAFAIHRA